ncbi:acyltransferase [Enorma phocaeensis]|uniref:acyltransferase n=1 Tax=Enorma phocaeensis TaxID=1871019 RepID=UPI0023562F2B|nr:acyltransferase [Enorma phocaeensis]
MTAQIHPTAIVDDGAMIGDGTKIWHFCHIQPGAHIGQNCSLGQNVNVANDVRIGNGVKIQNNVSVYKGVELEDWVFCGPSCVFTNDLTPRAKYPKGEAGYLHTHVRTGASIGANATIVCGHEIGEWAMIGAGAVVTTDVPAHALMRGVPARQAGWVCECGKVLVEESNGGGYVCLECGRRYRRAPSGLVSDHEHSCPHLSGATSKDV